MKLQLTKRYRPFHAIGSFMCSHCIIESAKNIIGMEFPEILQMTTHKEGNDEFISELAIKCMIKIIVKKELSNSLFPIDGKLFLVNNFPGTVFIGASTETIADDETKSDFFERIKKEIMSLELMKDKVDDDMSEEDHQHYGELFDIKLLSDIVVLFTKKEDENDVDDIDIGYEEGMNAGMERNYILIQIALYKMFKKKKLKDLDFILDEINNTIGGMSESDLKVWTKNFKKYLDKKNKKEQNIEGDN